MRPGRHDGASLSRAHILRTRMNNRKLVTGAVLVFIGLLVVFVLRVPVPVHDLNQTNGMIVSSGQKREYQIGRASCRERV